MCCLVHPPKCQRVGDASCWPHASRKSELKHSVTHKNTTVAHFPTEKKMPPGPYDGSLGLPLFHLCDISAVGFPKKKNSDKTTHTKRPKKQTKKNHLHNKLRAEHLQTIRNEAWERAKNRKQPLKSGAHPYPHVGVFSVG